MFVFRKHGEQDCPRLSMMDTFSWIVDYNQILWKVQLLHGDLQVLFYTTPFAGRVIAVRLLVKDERQQEIGLYLVSAYAPVGVADQNYWDEFIEKVDLCVSKKLPGDILVIWCDTNSSLGTKRKDLKTSISRAKNNWIVSICSKRMLWTILFLIKEPERSGIRWLLWKMDCVSSNQLLRKWC